ncbi:MAG: ABC transporter permease [Candidatus Dormibacteria bacterium]
MELIRNLWRRKLRSFLTITGIFMGILALVTMGGLAEHFNALIDGGVRYFSNNIQVSQSSNGGFSGGIMKLSVKDELEKIEGVALASPGVTLAAKPGSIGGGFNAADAITNYDARAAEYSAFKTTLAAGRRVTDESRGEVVFGSAIAKEFNKKVGDAIDLPVRPSDAKADFVNHHFRVVGILNPTLTVPDNFAEVSLHDAQLLFGDQLPPAIKGTLDPFSLVGGMAVFGKPGVNLDNLADRINRDVPGVKALKPSVLVAQFKTFSLTFTAITTVAALLALVIGGISVVNTMLMAVTERIREIGLKKAVGARTGHIMREFVSESTLIGAIGGLLGLAVGAVAISVLNHAFGGTGGIFLLTPRLAIGAVMFAILLGALAGLLPATRAARMDPVMALRSVG